MEPYHTLSTQSPPSLPVLFERSHQLHHTLLIICFSLHGTGWEQVLGVQELQEPVLGAAAPSSIPLSAPRCFWHPGCSLGTRICTRQSPPAALSVVAELVSVGLKRKEEAQQFVGRRNAEKTLGIVSVWEGSKWWHSQGQRSSRGGAGQEVGPGTSPGCAAQGGWAVSHQGGSRDSPEGRRGQEWAGRTLVQR